MFLLETENYWLFNANFLKMSYNKILEFTAAVRDFHYYKSVWQPKQNEVLRCEFENGNTCGMFAAKTVDDNNRIVRHFSREVSRITKLIIDRGANFQARLIGIHYRSSPLM